MTDALASPVIGTPKQRLAALDRPADLYVVNYDNLKWLAEEVIKRRSVFSVVIADESSKIKNPTAQRTKVMLALGGLASRRWTLTGTPRGQQLLDVWAPAQFVTRGRAFPRSTPGATATSSRSTSTSGNGNRGLGYRAAGVTVECGVLHVLSSQTVSRRTTSKMPK